MQKYRSLIGFYGLLKIASRFSRDNQARVDGTEAKDLGQSLGNPGVRFTKVFRTELGHKYILVECSVIALCLPVVSKLSRYKLVCYK